jgi:hypothetical protein
VKAKKIDVSAANAIAQTSREIMSVINTEIRIAAMTGAKLQGFVSPALPGAKHKQRKA